MRPPGPVPVIDAALRLFSAMSLRTTGDNTAEVLEPSDDVGAEATVADAGVDSETFELVRVDGAAAGVEATGAGAGAAVTTAAEAAGAAATGAADASPTTAMTVPTGTVSPSATRISVRTPEIGDGTSVSTLSVETSKSGSSSATVSPTFLNHFVMVPSVTVSPS